MPNAETKSLLLPLRLLAMDYNKRKYDKTEKWTNSSNHNESAKQTIIGY